jgi:hypothetical protein
MSTSFISVRALKAGCYQIIVEPQKYAPLLQISSFSSKAEAAAWLKLHRRCLEESDDA